MSRHKNPAFVEPLTIIIPARNAEGTIERCVRSACSSGATRVYVYDDGSTDDTFEILSMMYESEEFDPTLEIWSITEFRAGVVFARNYLIEQCDSGFIIPLDADDTIRNITEFKLQYEPGTWLYGDYVEHDGMNENVIQSPPPGVLGRKNLCQATMLFHKRDWLAVGGYDVDFAYAEDFAFQCSLTNAGIRPKHFEGVIFDRYLHPTGNERTAMATTHWKFYQDMARGKYNAVFAATR
jgi:glycosyltransferase involved in cell wall biosynthesis